MISVSLDKRWLRGIFIKILDRIQISGLTMGFHALGQHLNACIQTGNGFEQSCFNVCAQLGGALHRPLARHMHVQIDKAALASAAGGDIVKLQAGLLGKALQHSVDALAL